MFYWKNKSCVLPTMDQCSCLHWLPLSPSHLNAYLEVPAKDDRVITNGRLLGFSSTRALGKNIELEIKIVHEETMFTIMINTHCQMVSFVIKFYSLQNCFKNQ